MPTLDPAVQRVLEAAEDGGVTLDVRVFDVSTHTAAEAASALGTELGQIVKSLVFVVPREAGPEPVVCLVSGPNRVDIGRLAEVLASPAIRRASASEARELTGFAIGGIPPIGHRQPARVVMDPALEAFDVVWAAAGTSRAVFPIRPRELAGLSGALVAPIAEDPTSRPAG